MIKVMTEEEISKWLSECDIYDYELIHDNKYFVGRYDVMFGTRIRGGFVGGLCCDFDVCCGKSEELLKLVHAVYAKKIKNNFAENSVPATGLKSISEYKPINMDKEYMKWLLKLKEELGI